MRNSGSDFATIFASALSAYSVIFAVLPIFLLSFLIIYIVGLFPASRSGEQRDPMLGVKVATFMAISFALQIMLLGSALFLSLLIDQKPELAVKNGMSLVLGGLLSGIYPVIGYFLRIHGKGDARVLRQSIGVNAIITGLVFVSSVTIATWLMFNSSGGLGRVLVYPVSFTIVYFSGNLLCTLPLMSSIQLGGQQPQPGPVSQMGTIPDPDMITCPKCGQKYPRNAEWAGKAIQCSCGQVINVPA